MKNILLQAVRFAVIAGAAASAVYLLILVDAELLFQQDTAVSVAAAVHLQPHSAVYLDRLASWQSEDRQNLLQRSVKEDPFDYDAWIRLGLLAEMQDGDNAAAETYYRKAADVNHMFLPRWTLTNFYFRRQNPGEFFHWARETLAITPYASDPIFAQMWLMSQDENTLNKAIPDRPRILLQYAWYLASNKQFESVPNAVDRLVREVGKEDPGKWGRDDLLADSLDHMLAAGYLKPALRVWSTLEGAGWLDEPVPNDRRPLTNGDFRGRFYRHGFDWMNAGNPGTRLQQHPDAPDVRISLYGDEAEKVTLLQQYVAVAPGQRYQMTWQVQGEDLLIPTGLAWHLHSVRLANGAPGPELVSGDLLSAQHGWTFVAPSKVNVFLLALEYTRPLGNIPARGAVTLKSVALSPQ
jgi:tetratricopeptide (TPR) repeat protein